MMDFLVLNQKSDTVVEAVLSFPKAERAKWWQTRLGYGRVTDRKLVVGMQFMRDLFVKLGAPGELVGAAGVLEMTLNGRFRAVDLNSRARAIEELARVYGNRTY